MNHADAPPQGERRGESRHAGHLVGRESEMERIRAFLAAARTDGEALLVTGEPGVGKTVLLDAASAAPAHGMRILRAAGVQFEAGTSFSGLNQVLLPLLGGIGLTAVLGVTLKDSYSPDYGSGASIGGVGLEQQGPAAAPRGGEDTGLLRPNLVSRQTRRH
jgi:hypothetical protein